MSRRSDFQQRVQDVYLLPVVVEDSGYPAQSSTSTLQVRVCSCGAGGSVLSCSAEAILLPVGLSTGALMAILLCVALLIGTEHTAASSTSTAHSPDNTHREEHHHFWTGSNTTGAAATSPVAHWWCFNTHRSILMSSLLISSIVLLLISNTDTNICC